MPIVRFGRDPLALTIVALDRNRRRPKPLLPIEEAWNLPITAEITAKQQQRIPHPPSAMGQQKVSLAFALSV